MSKDILISGSANLVPCVTNANVSLSAEPTSGGGGGGGGGGPNLLVSTLSFPSSGVINMSGTLTIDDPSTAVLTDYYFITGVPSSQNEAVLSSYASTVNYLQVNGPGGDGGNCQLFLQGSADGRGVLGVTNANGALSTLTVLGDSVNMPTNLQVSSINGATPGGGINPSTIQLSTIKFGNAGAGFGVLDVTGVNSVVIQNTTTSATDFQFYTNYQTTATPGTAFVATAPNTNTAVNITSENSGQNQILITGNYPLTVTASTIALKANQVNTSSLLISTINGAPYPPASSLYPIVSTITQAGGSQISLYTSTNAVVQVCPSLSTVIGHNYQVTFPFGINPVATPSYDEVLTVSYQPDGVGSTPSLQTIPIVSNGFNRNPITYKARLGTGGVAFLVEANTASAVELLLDNLEGTTIVDLGPST